MADGDPLYQFLPRDRDNPSSNPGQLSSRNDISCINFPAGSRTSVYFPFFMPFHYGGNGVTFYLVYVMATANSGNVDVETAFERKGNGTQNMDTHNFATPVAVVDTDVPTTNGLTDVIEIAHTNAQLDGLLAGEYGIVEVAREGGDDTATGALQLLALFMRETP